MCVGVVHRGSTALTFQRVQAVIDWVSVELGGDMGSFEFIFFFMAVSVDLGSWNIEGIEWWMKRWTNRALLSTSQPGKVVTF